MLEIEWMNFNLSKVEGNINNPVWIFKI